MLLSYDVPRLLRLLIWSGAVGTPIAHFWFGWLDKTILLKPFPLAVAVKLVLDQTVMTPIGTAAFFAGMKVRACRHGPHAACSAWRARARSPRPGAPRPPQPQVMQGQPEAVVPELKSKLWPVLRANWMLWPLVNAVNFALVPPQQRILFVTSISVSCCCALGHVRQCA